MEDIIFLIYDKLLSSACLRLENMNLGGSGRNLEATNEKKILPYSIPGDSDSPKHKIIHNTMTLAHYSGRRIS